MKNLAKETWQVLRFNGRYILLFEVLYRMVTLPIYLQMLNRGIRFALRMAGYSYLTAANIGMFLIQPWTVAVITCLLILGIIFLMLEIAGLITAFEGAAYAQRLAPLSIFWGGLQKVVVEVKRKNIKLCGIVLVHYLLIHLCLVARALVRIKPINFVIQETISEPWMQLLLLGLVAVCAWIAASSMFVFYGCMVEQKSFSDSWVRSLQILKRHPARFVTMLISCNAAVVLLVVLAYFFSVIAAGVFVVLVINTRLELAVLFSVAGQLELMMLGVGGIFLMILHFGVLSVMYYQYGMRDKEETKRWDFSYLGKGTRSRKQICALAGVVTAFSLFYIFDLVYNGSALANTSLSEIQITAHRGSSRTAPENTMAALLAAIEEMADYAEIDVQLTADGVVVLGHDSSLRRVAGISESIGSMDWQELQNVDVGSWFSDDYKDERIPSLEEVMEVCKGKLNLNIEIKNVGKNSVLPEKVVELILNHGMQQQCVVTSTSLSYLKRVKELAPELHTGYIVSAAYGDFYTIDAVDFVSLRYNFVTESLVESIHEQGKAVHAWTVNSKNEMERMQMLKVDNVITDYPVRAREILYREEAAETLLSYLRQVLR
ncbi:MAG: glycerophosphodiester phosphodiesterase family protein [Lachnospiraceae bacterium]